MASFFDKLIAPSDVPKDADVLEKISIEVKELHQKVSKYFSRLDKSKEPQTKSEKLSDLALQNEQKILDKVSLLEKSTAIFSNKITFTLPKNAKLLLSRLKLYDNSLSKIFGNIMTKVRMRIDKMMEKFTVQFYKDYADKKIKWFMESSKKVIGRFFQTLKDMPGNFFDKVYEVSFGLVSKILGVLGPIAKPFISMAGWFIKGGMKLLSTIFTAVTEILLLPLELMTSVAGFIAKGVLGLFRGLFFFMFTPPGLFFIGIPLLYFLVPKILSYIWEGIKASAQYIDNMLIKHFGIDVRALWTDTIWPFVVEIWDSYKGSRLHAKIKEYAGVLKLWFDSAMKYVFGDDIFDRIHGWWDSVTLYFDHVKSAFTFMWDNINWVYGIVATHMFIKIVNAFRNISKFVGVIYNFMKFVIGGIVKFTSWVITKTAKFIGRIFTKFFPNLAAKIGKFFSFIGRTSSLIGRVAGLALRIGLRVFSIVGWAMTIYDLLSIGWSWYKANKAKRGLREVIQRDSTKISDYIKTLERSSNPMFLDVDDKRVERYRSIGLSQDEAIILAQDDEKIQNILNSSSHISAFFAFIKFTSSPNDRENIDAQIAEDSIMDLYNIISQVQSSNDIHPDSLMSISELASTRLQDIKERWDRIKAIRRPGLVSNEWQITPGFSSNMESALNSFSNIVNNFSTYATRRAERLRSETYTKTFGVPIQSDVVDIASYYGNALSNTVNPSQELKTRQLFTRLLSDYYSDERVDESYVIRFITPLLQENKISDEHYNNAMDIVRQAISEVRSIRIPPSKTFANGGIILQSGVDKVLPLDSTSLEIVYQHIKDIETEKPKNKEQNDLNRHITIIEETNNIIESFELYTMNRLSRGILGV
jgi:hypothetical protein